MSIEQKKLVSANDPETLVVAQRLPGPCGPMQYTLGTAQNVLEYMTVDSGYEIIPDVFAYGRLVTPYNIRMLAPYRMQSHYEYPEHATIGTLQLLQRGSPGQTEYGMGLRGYPLLMTVDQARLEQNPWLHKAHDILWRLPVYRVHTLPGTLMQWMSSGEKHTILEDRLPPASLPIGVDLDDIAITWRDSLGFQLDVVSRLSECLSRQEMNRWAMQLIERNGGSMREKAMLAGAYVK